MLFVPPLLAEDAGAKKAGGSDLVQGETDVSDFDHFLATEEMALEGDPEGQRRIWATSPMISRISSRHFHIGC